MRARSAHDVRTTKAPRRGTLAADRSVDPARFQLREASSRGRRKMYEPARVLHRHKTSMCTVSIQNGRNMGST